MLRNLLFDGVFEFSKKLMAEHITLSAHSNCSSLKHNVESLLEYRHGPSGSKALRPPMGNKIVCYIQDLHLSDADAFGDQSAVEAIRECLEAKAWLSIRKLRVRKIEDVCFFGDMASNHPATETVSGRALHHFNLVFLSGFTHESFRAKVQTMADVAMAPWPQNMLGRGYSQRLVSALVDLSGRVLEHLRPTPMKAHYTFNWNDLSKIIFSIQMVESSSMKSQRHVMNLLYHECLRTYGDRLLMHHDRQYFLQNLEEVCRKHFSVVDEKSPEYRELRASLSAEALREHLARQD